jgi:parallel beta-helix repeat protein
MTYKFSPTDKQIYQFCIIICRGKIMKKIFSIGVILFFVGVSLSSSSGFNLEKQSIPTDRKTLYVGGSGPGNYSKIQDAIDNASNGDTVYVYNGTYYESLNVFKSINLIGEDKESTIIYSNQLGNVVNISSDFVNISRFTIKKASDNGNICIYLNYSHNTSINGNIIIIKNCGYYSFAIRARYSNGTRIIGNTISNKNGYGIIMTDAYNNQITGNNISNNFLASIEIWYTKNNIITNNIVSNCGWGINITDSCNDIISGNKISNARFFSALALWGGKNSNITGNIISESNYEGIQIGSNNITITRNIISKNGVGIYNRFSSCNNNLIYHNNFINNTPNAYDKGSNTWDDGYPSGGNYWSDYPGNDSDGDGIGDTPYSIPGGNNEDRYPLMDPFGNWSFPPIAKFNWKPSHPNQNETIHFNASDSFDIDGNITLYEWDWDDDGKFDENHTDYIVTHSWSEYGYYPVTLRVTDNDNLSDNKTKTVRVGNSPPDTPIIDGPTFVKPGTYDYTFCSTDPEGHDVYYWINTSKGNIRWIGPYKSGDNVTISITWHKKGTYIIKVKAKDIFGNESDWGILEVTVPRSKIIQIPKWMERFPILNQLITRIMERWSI